MHLKTAGQNMGKKSWQNYKKKKKDESTIILGHFNILSVINLCLLGDRV